jgi:RimJ/RimL family protein N-acetyltransferase
VIVGPIDRARRDALLRGEFGDLDAAPGWPHEDTEGAMSFLDSGGWVFLIIDGAGRIAGECGTKAAVGADGVVEIGYGLAASSRGRGLGGAAVAALVEWLAQRPEIRAVAAEVHVGNVASWRLLERLGFVATDELTRAYRRYELSAVGHPEQRES